VIRFAIEMATLDKKALEFFRKQGKLGGEKRAAKMPPERRSETAQHASRAYWDSLTPEERSAEMKRRAAKRKKGQK
jgi:hypothetical protein